MIMEIIGNPKITVLWLILFLPTMVTVISKFGKYKNPYSILGITEITIAVTSGVEPLHRVYKATMPFNYQTWS